MTIGVFLADPHHHQINVLDLRKGPPTKITQIPSYSLFRFPIVIVISGFPIWKISQTSSTNRKSRIVGQIPAINLKV